MLYRFFRTLARLALHLFFRRIEVEGLRFVPTYGPVLFVPNHSNALVDPLVLMISLRRRLTVTAKNVLAKKPLLGFLMRGLGVVTFHRRDDVGKGADPRQNVHSLQHCRTILADGGAICIFPEGISHSDPKLREFRLGPARIARDFVRKDGNPGRLKIVPVGLLYSAKDQFRSEVWLRFGVPIDVEQWLGERAPDDVEQLTGEIQQRVQALTLNFATRRESLILSWAADIVATEGAMPVPLGSGGRPVAEWFRLIGRLQRGYRSLLASHREQIEQLSARIRRYHSELRRRGITAAEVHLPLHAGRAVLFLVREFELLAVGLPLAMFGALNHAVPYFTVKTIARKLSRDKDQWASNVIYPSLAIFPLCYVLQLLAAWLSVPFGWALLYTVALPFTGYYALLYSERVGGAARRTRTFCQFLLDRSIQYRLVGEGRAILAEIRALGERVPADTAAGDAESAPLSFAQNAFDFETQLNCDCETLDEIRSGLDRLESVWQESRGTIAARNRGYFTPDEDDRVRQMLLVYRNYRLALYELIERYADYDQLDRVADQLRGFMLGYAAALTLYAKSLRLIQEYEHVPLVRQKLNEPDAKFAIETGFFEAILRAFTSLTNYQLLGSAGRYWLRHRREVRLLQLDQQDPWRSIAEVIRGERVAVRRRFWNILGKRLRFRWRLITHWLTGPVHEARYGLQAFIGSTFATARTTLNYRPSIDSTTLERLRSQVQPGDVLLVRSERKLTTALLPGFWAHAALYIGGRRDLEPLEVHAHPHVRRHWDSITPDGGRFGHVVEAIAPRAIINSLERCLFADHVVVLRPCVSPAERQAAIIEAFGHLGKLYDFEFDFNVSTRVVCTELIYRSYHRRGPIEFPLTKRLGRFTLSGDDIMNWFLDTLERGGPRPFDVVCLVLQSGDATAQFVPEATVVDTLRAIQHGFRPASSVRAESPDAG